MASETLRNGLKPLHSNFTRNRTKIFANRLKWVNSTWKMLIDALSAVATFVQNNAPRLVAEIAKSPIHGMSYFCHTANSLRQRWMVSIIFFMFIIITAKEAWFELMRHVRD